MIDRDRAHAFRDILRRPAVLATIGTLSLALVFGGLLWATAQPSRLATVSATSEPGVPSDAWSSLAPSPSDDVAVPAAIPTLSARGMQGGVVPLETGFRLESVDGTSASALAKAISVDPPFDFTTQAESGDRAVVLTPTEPLHPGYVYRFDLHGTAGALLETWAFQASQPLRVVGTLPEDGSAEVPTNTGIEVTFDQDGATDAESHLAIQPATKGRFEQHERTVVFVPDRPLKPATIYTVTVSRGVTVGTTGEASDIDTRFRFETASTTGPAHAALFAWQDDVVESPVAERPALALWYIGDDGVGNPPARTFVEVYRLAGLQGGIDAFRTIRARPDWAEWSTEGIVDTHGLTRVVRAKLRLEPYQGNYFIRLPEALDAGWYLVQLPDKTRPSQVVLQVTDVAGYLAISETRTAVWANDLASGDPVRGATATVGGSTIGTTDADGLTLGKTPAALLPESNQDCAQPCDAVVAVQARDGRAVFLPASSDHDKLESFGDSYPGSEGDRSFWALLHSDRYRYRPTDTINVWGAVRHRDNGSVPGSVSVRLTPESYDDSIHPPTATVNATPADTGAFTTSIALAGVAEGPYSLDLVVGGGIVRTTSVYIGPIVKPAYQLDIVTGRRVYIAGDRIRVNVSASFFEGTPVPSVPLRIDGYVERTVRTDAAGQAIHRTTAHVEAGQEDPETDTINVSPARAEEGEISGASHEFVVFPSSRTIAADASIKSGRVKVTGDVHEVDVDRLEAAIAGGSNIWDLDARGAPVRGATVTVRFIEQIPVRTRTGTQYDFIEKRVVPTYETRLEERVVRDVHVKTAADGSYAASIAASTADHDYRIVASVGDPDGHRARRTSYANRHPWESWDTPRAALTPSKPQGGAGPYGIGDRIDLTLTDPDVPRSAHDGSRYLFFEAHRGLHSATVQASPRYVTTFHDWATPNLGIGGIRFTGRGYTVVGFEAEFRTGDRALTVDLTPKAARYAPGGTATVDVRTRDAAGRGVPASVILRGVDEKLFTIGAASEDDPLNELYAPVESGMTGSYASHAAPANLGEGGDTTGGGGDDRQDFRDAVLFRMVQTDANGRASVSFDVSDDLTSWRVSASAITKDLKAGYGSVLVPVGLPFFVDASLASEYLVADRPSIPVRVFGSAMAPGDPVRVRVTSKTLGFDSGPIDAEAFDTTLVPLPNLTPGTHSITFSATSGTGPAAKTDRLTRTFTVVTTRLMSTRTAYVEMPGASEIAGGKGLTQIRISDASAGRYLPLLTELASGGGARLDRGLAAAIAADLLARDFGITDANPTDPVVTERYERDGGLSLMPYSSSDLWLSSLIALTAPDRIDAGQLANQLATVRADKAETRERQMIALAGLAGLGAPVLPAIQAAAADPSLTVRERLMIGLGAARLGDAKTARSVATALRNETGEQAGSMARLRVGTSIADTTEATALMAVLAAAVGDDLAAEYWAYVEANPIVDQLHVLEGAAFVADSLERAPVQPVKFAYVLDGVSQTVELEAGQSFGLSVDAAQLASFRVEPTTGSIGVATSWLEPVRLADVARDPDVKIRREVTPTGTVDPSDLVTVTLTVSFGAQAASGCHQVTELVPSGLAAVGPSAAWAQQEAENGEVPRLQGLVLPYDTSGPRVSFCAEPSAKQPTVLLRYYARVVNPGTFAWEPAIALSRSQADTAARTTAGSITIR